MGNEESVKVYLGSVKVRIEDGSWEDRVKEYVSERGVRGNGLEWARREYMERERWKSVCHGHPSPWGRFRWERSVRAID